MTAATMTRCYSD